jgi:hypothetical protein
VSASYEVWLCDDAGRKMAFFPKFSYLSFSRTTRGLGTVLFGLPLQPYLSSVPYLFQPDWRLDIWRSPETGYKSRREGSFFLRKFNIYNNETGTPVIQFYGRSPLDILRRWSVSSTAAADYAKTDNIDDMMKAVVRDGFITTPHVAPAGEFSVDGDLGLGPTISQSFPGKNIRDVITDLKATSFSLNANSSANRRIFFDVVEGPGLTNGFGYIFRTYADLRGDDRTNGTVFSVENGNLKTPSYFEDYLDQITSAQCGNVTVSGPDTTLSRWNTIQQYMSSISTDANVQTARANQMLSDGAKKFSFTANFLSTPGNAFQPRSLYGIDWDLGDLLPVQYAGKNMSAEVEIIWLSLNDQGQENIVGSNQVGSV